MRFDTTTTELASGLSTMLWTPCAACPGPSASGERPARSMRFPTTRQPARGPVWLAASTHEGEEEQIASAHRILREHLPGILTILVPRHATRGEAIEQMLTAQGLNVACRSQNDELAGWTDIYLADTMGELGLFYRLAPVVFIGGSLVPHGGQNPLEPARLHCAILCGPHMTNFPDIMETLHAHHAILEVEDAADLAHQVAHLLGGTPRREALDKAAYELVSSKKGVLETILRTLQPYLTT